MFQYPRKTSSFTCAKMCSSERWGSAHTDRNCHFKLSSVIFSVFVYFTAFYIDDEQAAMSNAI